MARAAKISGNRPDYLRLSLTDRCGLNCVYCTPLEKAEIFGHADLLRHEELALAAAAFVRAGVRKIRLTGGEPLLKKNIVGLVRLLRAIRGLQELALTTNGLLLPELAAPLRKAGLDSVNISLNSLRPAAYRKITGGASFRPAWSGVMAALGAGFRKVKLNVVILRGLNDREVEDFAALTLKYPLSVRFIELFSANKRASRLRGSHFSTAEVRARIEAAYGPLRPLPLRRAAGPAKNFRLKGAMGEIGFISNRSEYFCGACTRVRMDCVGRVYPCLFSPPVLGLREFIRSGATMAVLAACLKKTFLVKSEYRKDSPTAGHVEMSSIGG